MSVREEDIDYSDIPPLKITEHTRIERVGDKFRKVAERNLARLNEIFREYDEMKETLKEMRALLDKVDKPIPKEN